MCHVRFADVEGLTTLPVEQLGDWFRNEEVVTVLPVRAEGSPRDTLLVATTTKLAILTGEPSGTGGWMSRWAPWDAVGLTNAGATSADDDTQVLTVQVDRVRFRAELQGEPGRRGLRDFVVAVQACQAALAATW